MPEDLLKTGRLLQQGLAFHLISAHRNAAAFEMDIRGLTTSHRDAHSLLNMPDHPFSWHDWDADQLEEILEDAERGNYGFTRNTLPNGMAKDHIWILNECGNVPRIGNH
jgi:hypothetical protein